MITYAVGIDSAGKTSAIEVLAYRESHGGEIRGTAWRRQFAGRQGLEHLRFGTDIKNIAGATLSCEHVTQGVRWVTALWQVMLRTAPAAAADAGGHAVDAAGAVGVVGAAGADAAAGATGGGPAGAIAAAGATGAGAAGAVAAASGSSAPGPLV